MALGQPHFCAAPWHSVMIKWHGGVVPDSQFDGQFGNIYSETLDQIWRRQLAKDVRADLLRGETPHACRQCSVKEQSLGHSRRRFFQDVMNPFLQEGEFDVDQEPDVYFLEITASNLCNLKCIMCSGRVSTSWIKDEERLAAQGASYARPPLGSMKPIRARENLLANLFANPRSFRNLCYVSLKGGEPFLEPLNESIIGFLIDQGYASNITLDLTTNGTVLDDRLLKSFAHFKQVKLHVSVEATGQLYSYIRGGVRFGIEDLQHHWREFNKLTNCRLICTVTVMAHNLFDIGNVWRWFQFMRAPKNEIYFKNVVVNPAYMSPHVLPLRLREEAVEMLRASDIPMDGHHGTLGLADALLKDLYTEETRLCHYQDLAAFTRDLDAIRGVDIRKLVPQLADLY